jgi:hypothetical protein
MTPIRRLVPQLLAVQVTPEHVRQGLADLGAGRDGLRKHRLRIGHFERKDDGRPADRWRGEHSHLGELVSEMQNAVPDSQLN